MQTFTHTPTSARLYMNYRIEQSGEHEWVVHKGDERHFARTPEDAVRLKVALEKA